MAQAVPEIYMKMVKWNSALTFLASTYWTYRSPDDAPSIQDRMIIWNNHSPCDLLQYTQFEPSKSFIKALAKIPAEDSTHFLIRALRDHWKISENRRLLQHLKEIKLENAWLLSCYPPILDPCIHRLAATSPSFDEYSILEIVGNLSNRRELHDLEAWPYRNRIHSWPQLLAAFNKFLRKINCIEETLPSPPVDGVEEDELHILPLQNRTALKCESGEMSNCIEQMDGEIYRREAYAYRLMKPERATVLIRRESDRWSIAEAMIAGNEREVSPKTWVRLRNWLKECQN